MGPRKHTYHVDRTHHSFLREQKCSGVAYPSRSNHDRTIRAGLVQRYTQLQNDLEHNMELLGDNFRLHLGCRPPQHSEKWFTAGLRRLKHMVVAVIAPEMVIMWAFRQWLAARKLAKKHSKSVFIFSCGSILLMFAIFRTPMDKDSWFFCCHGRV
jgi:hypothetical protein